MSYVTTDHCRLCNSEKLDEVLHLAPTPPANAFVAKEHLNDTQATFPLDLYQCKDCGHAQLRTVVDPEELFRHYVYVSGTTQSFIDHFRRYADVVVKRFKLTEHDLVVDIGSNDGTLLKAFKKHYLQVLGIDPAQDIARRCNDQQLETIPEFFDESTAERVIKDYGRATIVCANNVFAHCDDLRAFALNVKNILLEEGVFIFEVSYLVDMFKQTLFDMIYHEHVAYHSIGPLQKFFDSIGMELFDVMQVPTHGGSIRCFVQKKDGPYQKQGIIQTLIDEERQLGLDQPETLVRFGKEIEKKKKALQNLLWELKSNGKSIAGYGAPAKATTLMYHFGLDDKLIDYVIDDNTLKQSLYTPGLHIPVYSNDYLLEHRPDYLLILAWNFADLIIQNNQDYKKQGGQFIVPLPNLRVE